MKKLFLTLSTLLAFGLTQAVAQERVNVWASAFYNLENLFDTEDDPNNTGDNDFLPHGAYHWTSDKYEQKLGNIARVLGDLARPTVPAGPAFIGVAEVENRRVLEDLCARPELAAMNLQVIHREGPDRRGIDVGLLYNPMLFTPTSEAYYQFHYDGAPEDYRTREILVVTGNMAGERFGVVVGHWPSRYGGKKSSGFRKASAMISRHIYDSLRVAEPDMKVVICGDFNDDPNDESVMEGLQTSTTKAATPKGGLFNPTWALHHRGIGTLAYQDQWNFFDQQVVSDNLLGSDRSTLKFWKVEVFNPPYLLTPAGKYKGYPWRSFSGNVWQNGYADHLPTIVYYVKQQH
ncbi:MAG: endonuclease/exonuclease/phosphatase family protein [Bacteroidales bacterium]|nr:endonuclease/exonuclease/phosphatase family protein [Bacteroidales bacterium]